MIRRSSCAWALLALAWLAPGVSFAGKYIARATARGLVRRTLPQLKEIRGVWGNVHLDGARPDRRGNLDWKVERVDPSRPLARPVLTERGFVAMRRDSAVRGTKRVTTLGGVGSATH